MTKHDLRDDPPVRRVIFLRHGRTAWNAQGRWQGRLDVPLDAVGLRQAERAAALLVRDGTITRMVSSPARRAAQTASVLKGAFDLAGRPLARSVDERLVEIDMGRWSGLTHAEVAARWPAESAAIARGEDIRRGVDGETSEEASERVEAAVRDAVASLPTGQSALVVTHGAVIRGVAASMIELPVEVSRRVLVGVDNCRWVTLVRDEAAFDGGDNRETSWRLERWNAGE